MEGEVGGAEVGLSVAGLWYHVGRCEELEAGVGGAVVSVDGLLSLMARRWSYVVKDKPGHGSS